MKILKEFILRVFSIAILALSLAVILGTVDFISFNKLFDIFITYVSQNSMAVIGIASIVAITSIIGIFARISDQDEIKTGIAIKKSTGNVYISKDTFESIVANIAKSFASLKNYKVSINISDDGIIANIYTYILPDTVVPTLTAKLQETVKDAILKQTTIELKEVNVKIKGVYSQTEKVSS